MPDTLVDPSVSRAKFERELAEWRRQQDVYDQRGIWLLKADFPAVFAVFAAPKLKPPSVVFGALLDFTNYDLWPVSVQLANPFTRVPYKQKELPVQFKRRVPAVTPEALAAQGIMLQDGEQPMAIAHDPADVPFICLPGIREYHDHPAHSGDSWLLHRGRGEGTLYFILDQLYKYGVEAIKTYQVGMQFVISYHGEPPL